MDSKKLVNSSQLQISIEGAEFAKDFNYFITAELQGYGEKRRTDVSAKVKNPVFSSNIFYIPLPNYRIELDMKLLFAAFVVSAREGVQDPSKGQARHLGECVLELGPLAAPLTDISGAGVRQHLKFIRQKDKSQVTVGRFLVTLNLVNEQDLPAVEGGKMLGVITVEDIVQPLPAVDPITEFVWRARVDFRATVDVPLNKLTTTGLPSPYLEFG